MATTVVSRTLVQVNSTRTVPLPGGNQAAPIVREALASWANGTGDGQNDEIFSDDFEINAAAFENLDLYAATQRDDAEGTVRTVSLAKVKWIMLINNSSSGTIEVGGGTDGAAAADAWIGWLKDDSDKLVLPAGDALFASFGAGIAVANTTSHILCLAGITATQNVQVVIGGVSA